MTVPRLSLSKLHFPITALGPGRRIGIWFQGCSIRCAGCMSRDTWSFSRAGEPVETVVARITPWLAEADGVTISGGEPFDQPEGLLALLAGLRQSFDGDVLAYSGYAFGVLEAAHGRALSLIDALISEPFVEALPTDRPIRGSANQRLHLLTALGAERFAGLDTARAGSLDLVSGADGSVWIAGVPRRGDLHRLSHILATRGIRLATSAGRMGGAS
ncbi:MULTISPECIES: 4Fe-4S single cluster domain-containing protein [Rhodomicrobium]|uniref:4Fe-4S single cluster domain-containing protein n=1 Tax=Rhodomicrobium TaxID=1068 RepID=UPI000B4BB94A|nr:MULTISPECIES: 4Fe-4S single cluster domain-containing protein [Rhodomicrobium]